MPYLLEQKVGGVVVLHIEGSLIGADLSELGSRFDALIRQTRVRAVIEMSEVEAVTTPAITLMLRTALAVKRAGGRIVFVNARPEPRRTFAWCRLDRILEFVSGNVEEIAKGFAQPMVCTEATGRCDDGCGPSPG